MQNLTDRMAQTTIGNPFDQFDPAPEEANPFDAFDVPAGPAPSLNVAEKPRGLSDEIIAAATGPGIVPAAPKIPEPGIAETASRALSAFVEQTLGAGGATIQAAAEGVRENIVKPIARNSQPVALGFTERVNQLAEIDERVNARPNPVADYGLGIAEERRANVQELRAGIPEGGGKALLFDAASNAPQLLVPAAIGLVNPAAGMAAGLSLAGVSSFGGRYDELRNQRGLSVNESLSGAGVAGAAEILTEKLPLDFIIKTGDKTGLFGALKRIGIAGGAEGMQEGIVEAIEQAYNEGVLGDNVTLGEALEKVGYSALVGSIVGGAARGVSEVGQSALGRKPDPTNLPPLGGLSDAINRARPAPGAQPAPGGTATAAPATAASVAGTATDPVAAAATVPPPATDPNDIDVSATDAGTFFDDPPEEAAAPAAAAAVPTPPPAAEAGEQLRSLRSRIDALEAERKAAISPDVRKSLKADVSALQKQAAVIEFEALAADAEAKGDADTATRWRNAAEVMRQPEGPSAGVLAGLALKRAEAADAAGAPPPDLPAAAPDVVPEAPPTAGLSLDGAADAGVVPAADAAGLAAPALSADGAAVPAADDVTSAPSIPQPPQTKPVRRRKPKAVATEAPAAAAGPAVLSEDGAGEPAGGLSAPVVVDETAPGEPQAPKPSTDEPQAESAPEAAPEPIEDGETIVRVSSEPPVIDGEPAAAAHVEGGEAVPVTPGEVRKAVEKSPLDISAARRDLLQKIAAAAAAAPEEDVHNPNGRLPDDAFVTFAVPGDGKFKVRNLKANLDKFAKAVEKSAGFSARSKKHGITPGDLGMGRKSAAAASKPAQGPAAKPGAGSDSGGKKAGGDAGSDTAAADRRDDTASSAARDDQPAPPAGSAPAQTEGARIPEGMVPFGEPYYSGGELVQGYARFAKGEKVRFTPNKALVEIVGAVGPGPAWSRLIVEGEGLGEFTASASDLARIDDAGTVAATATDDPGAVAETATDAVAAAAAENAETRRTGRDDKGRLSDVGEKMAGARKDRPPSMHRDFTDADLQNLPLSEIWPAAEIEAIEDTLTAAVATAARAAIPAKPRTGYKVRSWADKVRAMRTIVQDMMRGDVSPETFVARLSAYSALKDFGAKVRLLAAIDRKHWKRIGDVNEYPDAFRHEGDRKIPVPQVRVEIDGRPVIFPVGSAVDAADVVRAALAGTQDGKKVAFEIRGNTKTGRYFINKVGDKEYRRLVEFDDVKSAREFLQTRYDEVLAAWEAVKDRDNVGKGDMRRDVNRERTGPDHRNGRDVTPGELAEAFGFRGIEFGNWVSQGGGGKERQGLMNQVYDGLMDLAAILKVPPRAISLNGTLGLALGSRGAGKAAAHFEPGNLVINLTKTAGAGALAHEWFHALDNYFARQRGGEKPMARGADAQQEYRQGNFITYRPEAWFVHATRGGKPTSKAWLEAMRKRNPNDPHFAPENWIPDPNHPKGVRTEVEARFAALVLALDASPMAARARTIDKGKEGYWSRIIERGARAFENYVLHKMALAGLSNDFLVNVRTAEEFVRDPGRYPYLLPAEVPAVAEAFDLLFGEMQTRTDDAGKVALFSRQGPRTAGQSVAAARQELVAEIGADGVQALERAGLLVLHADESALNPKQRGQGVRGMHRNGVLHLFPQNLAPGTAASVLLHEGTHDSADEGADGSVLLSALGMEGDVAWRRFERLAEQGSRQDRALAAEAKRRAAKEMLQLREEGGQATPARERSETLAHLVELASAKPQGLSATMRKLLADLVSAIKAQVLRSPLMRALPAAARTRLVENLRAADFVRAAREQVRQRAAVARPARNDSGAFSRGASQVAIDRGGRATPLVGDQAGRGPRRGEVIVERSPTGWRVAGKGAGVEDKDVRRALLVAQGERAAFSRGDMDRVADRMMRMGYAPQPAPRVQGARKLAKLIGDLDAGKITAADFDVAVRGLAAVMDDVVTTKAANRMMAERERGPDIVREKLLAARRRGELDSETVEFAMWAIGLNPAIAEDLAISVKTQKDGQSGTAGEYNPAASLMRLFKGADNHGTAVHEILHHAERMMPPEVQRGIQAEWTRAFAAAVEKASGPQLDALAKMAAAMTGDPAAVKAMQRAFKDGTLTYAEHYPLTNPSEFWAVNATRIMAERHAADSWVKKARQWLGEMVEKVRGLLGLPSDAPVLRGLRAVMEGDGSRQSPGMLFGGATLRDETFDRTSPEFRKQLADLERQHAGVLRAHREEGRPLPAPNGQPSNLTAGQWLTARTPNFKRWFGDWEIAGAVLPRSASTFDEARAQAQAFQGKSLTNNATGIVAQAGRNALDKMLSGKAVGKSESPVAHALAVANLDHLYQHAMLGWSKPDAEGNPNVKAIHRFFAPMRREGKPMLAKLTVKETVDPAHANPLYTVEAVEFNEKSPAAQWVDASANADGIDLTSIRSARDVKSLAQRVQDFDSATVSKIVDGNGEPMVVHHVTRNEFEAFREDKPIFVAFSEKLASIAALSSGRTMTLHAAAMRPVNTMETPIHFLDVSKTLQENPDADAVFVADEAGVSLAVRRSAQLKSVDSNNGNFDGADDRVAYSRPHRDDHAAVDFGADGRTTMRERGDRAEARTRARLGAMIDRVLRNRPQTRDRMDAARGHVRGAMLGTMTPRMIEESYGLAFPDGSLTAYVEAGIARAEEKHRRARESAETVERWQALGKAERDGLSELMHDATLAGVRPNGGLDTSALQALGRTLMKKRRAIEAGMANREDGGSERQRRSHARLVSQTNRLAGLLKNAEANHAKLAARYAAMSEEARAVYDDAEASLKVQFDEERAAQIRRIERLQVVDQDTGRYQPADAALIGDLKERLQRAYDEAQGPEPYFPLKRFGDFVVRVQPHEDFEPGMEPIEFFESEVDAAARVRQLVGQGYGAYQTTRSTFFEREFTGAAPEFMREALTMLDGSALSDSDKEAIRDQFHQLYLKSLPDASALKTRVHRVGVPGFHEDALRSFAFAVLHGGNRIANLNHVDRMTQAIEDMKTLKEDREATSDFATNRTRQQVIDEMQMHLRDTLAPQHSPTAFALQQAGFLWMLGGNVSTAVVNLTQTLQFTIPGLLSQFNPVSALKVFGQMAAGVASPMRMQFNVGGRRVSVDAPGGLSEAERRAYEELADRGVISVTMAHDLAGAAERGAEVSIPSRWRSRVMHLASLPQHTTERMNREIAAMSFYRLARQAGKSHEQAVDGAAKFAHETQFDYSAANRARAMRSPWVRVITLFKTYAANLIYRQWRDLRTTLGINAATAEERAMAGRAFALRTAMVGMTTGVTGVMGVSTVLGILNALRDLDDDDDQPADTERDLGLALEELVGEGAGDLLMHGALPRGVAERTNMAGLLLRDEDRDARNPQDTMMRIYESAFGPVGSILSRGLKGAEDIRDGDVLRGIGAALPNALGAPMKAVRYASEGMLNRDGSPILEDLTPGEIAGQVLGFTPSRSIPYWEEVNRQKNAEMALQQGSSRARLQWATAVLAEDAGAIAAGEAAVERWNERNPGYPIIASSLKAAVRRLASAREAKAEGRFVGKRAFSAIEEKREDDEAVR